MTNHDYAILTRPALATRTGRLIPAGTRVEVIPTIDGTGALVACVGDMFAIVRESEIERVA